MTYYAHSANRNGSKEQVGKHLRAVADRAAEFANPLGMANEARLAGVLHDLGKYSELFRRRLEGQERGLDHWTIGAWTALKEYKAIAAAMAIEGHHVGLQRIEGDRLRGLEPIRYAPMLHAGRRLTATDHEELVKHLERDGLAPAPIISPLYPTMTSTVSAMLDVRMLFSTLVDADYIETEAHFEAAPGETQTHRAPGPLLQAKMALALLLEKIRTCAGDLRSRSAADENLMEMRDRLLRDCLGKAGSPSGLFTLSAPTGSGKTLAMLAFALAHAEVNALRRVVVVIPYLSIIDQTARIYRQVFDRVMGEGYVLEQHSLSGLRGDPAGGEGEDNSDPRRAYVRRLAENWDAPLVVTTSVQMLESLFADRPSACRKLHRLARSVILFDEVQTLPIGLAVPTLKALAHLAARYDSTIVFATATQPAFSALDEHVRKEAPSGWRPTEIVSDQQKLFAASKRTRVLPPGDRLPWTEIADRLVGMPQALCIVNLKRHALRLLEILNANKAEGLFHISTNLCPAHRKVVLESVRNRLERGNPCLLVATQCVEAGVDIDFPVVFRSMGPLDAIAQAAGRCNRNGKRPSGDVHIFLPEDDGHGLYPSGDYEQATGIVDSLLREHGPAALDIHNPAALESYYRKLYSFARPEARRPELAEAIKIQDFPEVARLYRLIGNDAINVLVPYDVDAFRRLVEEARDGYLTAEWIRRARPFVVNIYRPRGNATVLHHIEPVRLRDGSDSMEWFLCRSEEHYDRAELGLCLPDSAGILIS